MAKKKTTKKKVTKKSVKKKTKSVEQDIKSENEIKKEISDLEKKEKKEEEFTRELQGEVKRLDEEVAKELKDTEKDIDKSKSPSKKTRIIASIIALIIIIFAVLYFTGIIFPKEDLTQYNDFEFRQNGEYWELKITAQDWLPFFYHPSEIDDIPVDAMAIQEISASASRENEVVLSLDPQAPSGLKMGQSIIEIQKVLTLPSFNTVIYSAALYELEAYNHKIVNCDFRAENQTVVEFITSDESSIVYEGENCIKLNAKDPEDFKRVSDALAFRLLGVINN